MAARTDTDMQPDESLRELASSTRRGKYALGSLAFIGLIAVIAVILYAFSMAVPGAIGVPGF